MKRVDFYKEYYTVTNRSFCDKLCMTPKEVERARQKGCQKISRGERKAFIFLQYAVFFACIMQQFFLGNSTITVFGMFFCFLMALITDFSIVKIELLYRTFSKDTVYCRILYKSFKGELGYVVERLNKATKKRTRGFYKYRLEYLISANKNVKIIFKPKCVKLKAFGRKYILDKKYGSEEKLLCDIIEYITKETVR